LHTKTRISKKLLISVKKNRNVNENYL